MTSIDIVLFDLGGVLVDLGGVGPMKELSAIDTDDEFWDRWLTCRWVRGFERGECTPEEFAAGIVEDWGLRVTAAAFLEAFQDWPGRLFPGAETLVEQVHAKVPIGCLSNTNALHWDRHFGTWPILEQFDYRFLSFELGVVKPDRSLRIRVARTSLPFRRTCCSSTTISSTSTGDRRGFRRPPRARRSRSPSRGRRDAGRS